MRQALLLSLFSRWQKANRKDREPPLGRGVSKGHTGWQGPTSAMNSNKTGTKWKFRSVWGLVGHGVRNEKALTLHRCSWEGERCGCQKMVE